jgi:hypothetical protein
VALTDFLQETQRLLNDELSAIYNTADLVAWINRARKQIAAEGQCIRVVPPTSGPITSITISSGGYGYVQPPVVTIPPPDSPSGFPPYPTGLQATATATISAGSVNSITITQPGSGYYQPIITFSSGLVPGVGVTAVAIASVSNVCQTSAGQEMYRFGDWNQLVSGNGVQSILAVQGVSVIWGNFRYTLLHVGWQRYQAVVRNYTLYQDNPAVWAQFGQGNQGTVFIYPPANGPYQLEPDCICLPIDLVDDTTQEAIPYPWTDAVPWLAAYYAYTHAQRDRDAERMWKEFEKFIKRARSYSQPRAITNFYGRG